jgi:hypothetical protein
MGGQAQFRHNENMAAGTFPTKSRLPVKSAVIQGIAGCHSRTASVQQCSLSSPSFSHRSPNNAPDETRMSGPYSIATISPGEIGRQSALPFSRSSGEEHC